jgi:hypothetical protein
MDERLIMVLVGLYLLAWFVSVGVSLWCLWSIGNTLGRLVDGQAKQLVVMANLKQVVECFWAMQEVKPTDESPAGDPNAPLTKPNMDLLGRIFSGSERVSEMVKTERAIASMPDVRDKAVLSIVEKTGCTKAQAEVLLDRANL